METAAKQYDSLAEAIHDVCGEATEILRKDPVTGGDINRAYILSISDGHKLFLKENRAGKIDFFVSETEGLRAIRDTGAISVPEVYAYGRDGENSYLLMEYIIPGRRGNDFYGEFGINLALMHRADCSGYAVGGKYGFITDNYIGAGYQVNTPEDSWIDFFRTHRLLPQIQRADSWFDTSERKAMDRLLERLDDLLVEPKQPALLHGDLWSGNYITGTDGKAWLIDPAVYVGNPEADIAMTQLFGGFPIDFYAGYYTEIEKVPGYEDRRDLYNLYHLLNHLNLFGDSYLGDVMNIVQRYS